jgi:predicted small metal-binding protein
LKTYTCACGWTKSSETLDELLEDIVHHGKENHPELEIDTKKICEYIENKNT